MERYGIPPELIPDFIGLKGDTCDNIPGVPGIGDKTAADLLQRFGSLEEVLDHVEDISGAKRKQNLIEHAEDARTSKQLATAKRDIPLEFDLAAFVVADPDRSKLRDMFRQFELRDPLRRLEEALGSADAAAPAPAAEQALRARRESTTLADVAKLPDTEVARGAGARRRPRTRCSPQTDWRFGRLRGGAELLIGEAPRPEELVEALGNRPSSRTTPSRSAWSRRCSRTTPRSPPTCSSPRAAPTRCASSSRSAASAPRSTMRRPPTRCWSRAGRLAARGDPRARTDRAANDVELPLVRVLREMEKAGLKLDTERLREISRA